VILLSDGQANEGLTDSDAIAAQCAELAAQGVTTSTYGLGNSFNEDLMVAMARAGGGNHYYGDTADDLMEPFQQELALLGNLCLRDLRIQATSPTAASLRLLNDFTAVDGGWRLPDLAWGAEAWAVFRLDVPAVAVATAGGTLPLLRVAVQGVGPGGEPVQLERVSLALPVLSPGAWDGLTDDDLVSRRLSELSAAQALTAVREAASADEWQRVDRLIEEASRRFAGNPWVAAMLESMQSIARSRSRERMMKESRYSASRLHSRLAAKDELPDVLTCREGVEIPAYLRRKASQGKGDL
jgi:Ca-activated chloride channel family protein